MTSSATFGTGSVTWPLGFVSAIVPDLSLGEVCSLAAEVGYDCVELMCWPVGKAERRYAGVTHIDVTDFGDKQVDEVQKTISESGVAISGLGYYPNLLAPDAAEAQVAGEHLRKVIRAARMLGLSVVSSFVGQDWHKSLDENWPAFLRFWPDLIKFAEDNGIRIAIENCPMLFTHDEWPSGKNLARSPVIWRRMFDAIPSDHFGLNYDPSHLVWQQMDYLKPLAEFSSKLFRIHCKDVHVDRERLDGVGALAYPLDYHAPRLPGSGDINWDLFFEHLEKSGYTGPTVVEVEDRRYERDFASRKESLQLSHGYLRRWARKSGVLPPPN